MSKKVCRWLVFGLFSTLSACAANPAPQTELPASSVPPERLIEAKTALKAFGYDPGAINGSWNAQTYQAALAFQSDVPGSGTRVLDEKMYKALGIDDFDGKHRAEIFVIDERAASLERKMKDMGRLDITLFIKELQSRDKKKIDLAFRRPKSIVFVIFDELGPGDKVRTYASNILEGKRNSWSESYHYEVDEATPTQPMIIINEFETGNPMFLIHHVFINGEQVDGRITRASG